MAGVQAARPCAAAGRDGAQARAGCEPLPRGPCRGARRRVLCGGGAGMTKPLAGRAALITGASQGLGREIAAAYVDAGASLMLCARDAALLDTTAAQLAALAGGGQRVLARPCDVSKPDQVSALVEAA